ncbi:BMP-binding endothelial regulator protein-like [Ptychodera flava]|uniref:BMP-binding endothelial regulator protein-like n=1 Tax=Ptychodera flava TaxID=63121 RepID=UPI00396A7DFE
MKQHTLQLIVILSLSVNLVLTEDSNQVSSDLSVKKRDAILEDCNPEYFGSRCIIDCPTQNVVPGECPLGKCCKPPENDSGCTVYDGDCTHPADCRGRSYTLPWLCTGGLVCCIPRTAQPQCGDGGRCIVDCPKENRIDGDCPGNRRHCCKSPTSDVACNKEFGNCVDRDDCLGPPEYSLPWRCEGDNNRVCCHDPRFVMVIHWVDCLWRKIKATFYCLSDRPIRITCVLRFYSNGTEITRETTLILPGEPFIMKEFTVPSCYEDYILEWRVNTSPPHSGYVVLYRCVNGGGKKDPHMLTFSGVKYNFQGYCSYTLVKDCRSKSPAFDITADFRGRYEPMEPPTRMVAVSTTVNGHDTYTFRDDHSVLRNGKLVLERELTIAGGVGRIKVEDDKVELSLGKEQVSLAWVAKDHAASVTIGSNEFAGKLCGMLGDGSRLMGHDLVKSDGSRTFNTTAFAESWMIPGSCP